MALGYCTALLMHLDAIAGINYPGKKITEQGFLQMLVNQTDRPAVIGEGYANGHRRTVNLKYKPRAVEGQISETADCDIDMTYAYKETTTTMSKYVQINIHTPDDTIRQYCEDASRSVALGGAPSGMMAEHLDSVLNSMNALYAKMETRLTTAMALVWGKNPRTGSNALADINIAADGTSHTLSDGVTQILADARRAEFCGTPQIVGNGRFLNFNMEQMRNALSFNQSGFDASQMLPWNFWYSQKTANTWGDNQIGVFAPGSVHLLENMYNVGAFAGLKGAVTKGVISDPRMPCWSPGGFNNMQFDIEFEYVSCPTTVTNGYSGSSTTINAGWVLRISKHYDLFTIPTDAYDGADPLNGSNGTHHYGIFNN